MRLQRLVRGAFYILLATAPLGTRYIVEMGRLEGIEIEAGTISLFGTQILALIIVALSFFARKKAAAKLSLAERVVFGGALTLMLLAALSACLSGDLRSSINVAWILLGVGVSAAIYRLRPSIRKSLWALVIGGAAQSLLATWQYAVQFVAPNKWLGLAMHLPEVPGTFVVETAAGRWLRAYGTLAHPNMLGTYLMLAVIAAVALTVVSRKRHQLLAATLVAVNALGLALSMSRSALLGLAFGLAALLTATFVFGRVDTLRWRRVVIAVAIAAVALLSSLTFLHEPVTARLTGQGRLERISVESRVSQLHDLKILLPGNWLLGVGPSLTPYALHDRDPGRSPWNYQYIHNVSLLVLVEVGLLGLLAWLVFIGSILVRAFRQRKQNLSPDQLAVRAAFVALLVASMFDHFLWSSWFGQLIFWLVAGLAIIACTKESKKV